MLPPLAIGRSDFKSLRENGCLYIDKSAFISHVLSEQIDVQLYPRPRRFGKTIAMSMLRYFLEKGAGDQALFSDLAVWKDEKARQHFNRYPVIFLTLKDIKHKTWAEAQQTLQKLLCMEVQRHQEALCSPRLSAAIQQRFQRFADWQAPIPAGILQELSLALFQVYQEKVVILLDEYDALLLTAWQYGYFEDAIAWFRSFMIAGLKDNSCLFRGVLTGILRIARESTFSGMNNVHVYSLLHRKTGEFFGFTQMEVENLLLRADRMAELNDVQRWYNGYRFGKSIIYNPWSILNFLQNQEMACQPYWLNTSDNALIRSLLLENSDLNEDIQALLCQKTIERKVEEEVPLRELRGNNIWGILLFSGYLRAESQRYEDGLLYVTLAIPNEEVRVVWRTTFINWLEQKAPHLEPLHRALLEGDGKRIENLLQMLLEKHVSEHDVKQTQDEVFYHAFVLGLLVTMEKTHFVRSNREVGLGRADVQVIPKKAGQPGAVLEFKKKEPKRTLSWHAGQALKQIQDQRYTVELEAAGATPIFKFGISFSGKEVVVRM